MTAPGSVLGDAVPSLAQWLGDGTRVDGFEEWVRDATAWQGVLPPDQAAAVRMLKILAIATLEACRIETEQHGEPVDRVLARLPSAAGMAVMAAVLCQAREDAGSLDALARVMARSFAAACKGMAAQTAKGGGR